MNGGAVLTGTLVSTETSLRDGFTTSSDARAWAVLRPIGRADIEGLDGTAGALRVIDMGPPMHTLDGTTSAVRSLLDAALAPQQVFPALGHLLRRGVLLAPLAGFRRSTWRFHNIVPELQRWVEEVEDRLDVGELSPKARRIIANLWLCTSEARATSPGVDEMKRFLGIHLDRSDKGKWLSGLPEHVIHGIRDLGVALDMPVSRKYSPLASQHVEIAAEHVSEWKALFEQFIEDKRLGSVSNYENAFQHLFSYLSENLQISSVEALFSRDVERTPFSEWLNPRVEGVRHRATIISALNRFFEWLLTRDGRFFVSDDWTGEPVVRPGVLLPIRPSEVDNEWSRKKDVSEEPSETVQMALPTEYLEEVERILFERDMTWPKQRSVDWVDWIDPATGKSEKVYCPVLPYLVAMLIRLPIRQVQARRLDSGEGDSDAFDLGTNAWSPNNGPHAGYWRSLGVAQPLRGVLRKVEDTFARRVLCGFFINSNKAADRRTLFDERSGYVIQWHNEGVIDLVARMRAWQEKYNPLDAPTEYHRVRPGVFEKMAKNVALRRPACFYLFRYPAGNSKEYRSSPPSSQQVRMFWYEILGELEKRMKAKFPDAPDLISTWLGPSPQASPYTLHGLRHAGLTRLAMAGVHPWILQNIVAGHAAWVMTLYYIKLNAAHISDVLTEAYVKAMREEQHKFRQFLSERTIEEVHRVAVGGSHALRSLEALRKCGLKNISGHLAPLDHGVCPNGRTRCDEGIRLADRTEYKPKEAQNVYGPVPPTVGGAPDCTRCIFFITGTPFAEGLRLKTNEVSVHAHQSGVRFGGLRRTIDDMEAARASSLKAGDPPDVRQQHGLHAARQELKAEADVLANLTESMHAHVQMWQKVRAIARAQKRTGKQDVPALLFDEVPEFRWDLQPRFEAIDELCQAAVWFPSIRTVDLRRERREKVMRLLVRNNKPPALALMSEEEADVAASAIVASLYKRWGTTAARKLFEDQETFESLGIADEVEEVMSEAIGKPVQLRIDQAPATPALGSIARAAAR